MALVELYIAAMSGIALFFVMAGLVIPLIPRVSRARASVDLRLVHGKAVVDAPRRPLHA